MQIPGHLVFLTPIIAILLWRTALCHSRPMKRQCQEQSKLADIARSAIVTSRTTETRYRLTCVSSRISVWSFNHPQTRTHAHATHTHTVLLISGWAWRHSLNNVFINLFLFMQYSPASYHYLRFKSQYLPSALRSQHPLDLYSSFCVRHQNSQSK